MHALPLALSIFSVAARADAATPKAAGPATTTVAATAPAAPEPPAAPKPAPAPLTSRWQASLYGFIELDSIYDSTESFVDLPGNAAIARPSSYAGRRPRLQLSIRNTRAGVKLAAPEVKGVKASAQIETDFFGNAPPGAGQTSGGVSEYGFFSNAGLRLRHAFLKVETPVVDVLAGQTWQLFGWNSTFQPCTVQVQGVPGEVFARTPQVRLSKVVKAAPVSIELALAAARPPQRDTAMPDGQAGVKVTLDTYKGVHTSNAAVTGVDGLTIGVSGIARRFALVPPAGGAYSEWATGWGYSIDALLPVIGGSMQARGNALTLTGSFVDGRGIADLYTSLSGGLASPAAFGKDSPTVDPGLVGFDAAGGLQPVRWRSFIVGAQYYLPPTGSVWLAVNYSQMKSDNISDLVGEAANATKVFSKSRWYDGNLFWDATDAIRVGAELSRYEQTYVDGTDVHEYRGVLSGFYLF